MSDSRDFAASPSVTTKKAFEVLLNEKYGKQLAAGNRTGWSANSGAKSRPYGSYLRSADREMFDQLYAQYLETGEL